MIKERRKAGKRIRRLRKILNSKEGIIALAKTMIKFIPPLPNYKALGKALMLDKEEIKDIESYDKDLNI